MDYTVQPTTGSVIPGVLSSVMFITVFIILSSAVFFQLSLIDSIKALYWNVMLSIVKFTNYSDDAILADYDSQIVNVLDYAQKVASNTSKLDVLDEDARKQIAEQNSSLFGSSVRIAIIVTLVGAMISGAILESLNFTNPITDASLRMLRIR